MSFSDRRRDSSEGRGVEEGRKRSGGEVHSTICNNIAKLSNVL